MPDAWVMDFLGGPHPAIHGEPWHPCREYYGPDYYEEEEHMSHARYVCSCGTVTRSCRCPGPHHDVVELCEACKAKPPAAPPRMTWEAFIASMDLSDAVWTGLVVVRCGCGLERCAGWQVHLPGESPKYPVPA